MAKLVLALLIGVTLATVSLAASAPAPAAETARPTSFITFYGHVFGTGLASPMPSNTQFPVGEGNYGISAADECTDSPAAAAIGDCESDPNNKLALYSTPGFVQIANAAEFNAKGGYQALHNEHGSTKDIVLDASQHIKATVFTSIDYHGWDVGGGATLCPVDTPEDVGCPYPYWGWDPGIALDAETHAKFYYAVLGDYGAAAGERPPIDTALASGKATLVAEGVVGPQQVENGLPGAPNVIKWSIDLGPPKVAVIPKEANFFMIFQYDQNGAAGEYGTQDTFRQWSGEYFPPSYTLPVKNAFDVERVTPAFLYGKLALAGVINTPWGSYDVDPAATRLAVTNAQGADVTPEHIDLLADYSVAHGAHFKPVNVTFVWDYLADKLPAGSYTATISAGNHEGSAHAQCSATFTIGENGAPGTATPGLCGQQTAGAFLNETGSMKMGGASDSGAASAPASPVAWLAGALHRIGG
ncbi:MAG: hypothetical protein ACYDCK_04450 [Thermoplasmatota archaeon]